MNRKGNLLWPLIKRRHVPGLTSYVERYFPKELHVSVPKKKNPQTVSISSLLPGWQKGPRNIQLYTGRRKKSEKPMMR